MLQCIKKPPLPPPPTLPPPVPPIQNDFSNKTTIMTTMRLMRCHVFSFIKVRVHLAPPSWVMCNSLIVVPVMSDFTPSLGVPYRQPAQEHTLGGPSSSRQTCTHILHLLSSLIHRFYTEKKFCTTFTPTFLFRKSLLLLENVSFFTPFSHKKYKISFSLHGNKTHP